MAHAAGRHHRAPAGIYGGPRGGGAAAAGQPSRRQPCGQGGALSVDAVARYQQLRPYISLFIDSELYLTALATWLTRYSLFALLSAHY
jgi:hypothetical protein